MESFSEILADIIEPSFLMEKSRSEMLVQETRAADIDSRYIVAAKEILLRNSKVCFVRSKVCKRNSLKVKL